MCFSHVEVIRFFHVVGLEFFEVVKAIDELHAKINRKKVRIHKYLQKIWFYDFNFGVMIYLYFYDA